MSAKQWAKLVAIGLVGGSLPFWLFFYAIKVGSEVYAPPYGVIAGFFHKATLFVFVAIFASVFLKEKLSKSFAFGGLVLIFANFLLLQNFQGIGFAELLLFLAIVLWAVENVISKWALNELSGNQVAFGRMFFGSIILIGLLFATGESSKFLAFESNLLFWSLATALPLFFFVFFWYNGLKHIEVSKATVILMLGQPVTVLLSAIFLSKIPSSIELLAMGLIVAGVILSVGFSQTVSFVRAPFSFLRETK